MKLVYYDSDHISINLTEDEVAIIANALKETCSEIRVRHFYARTGAYLEEMQSLLAEFQKLVEE